MNASDTAILDHASSGGALPAWPVANPVDELLGQLRLSGVVYCRSELTAPWGFTMPPMARCLAFHLVIEGECHLIDRNGETMLLQQGDVVLVTRGQGHSLASDGAAPLPDLFSLPRQANSAWYEWLQHGGGGARTLLLCCAVRIDNAVSEWLIRELPPVVPMRRVDLPEQNWLPPLLRGVAEEAVRPGPGAEVLMTRLADVVILQVLRSWLMKQPAHCQGWLAALRDRHVGRVIQHLHADTARAWTLSELAREAGLSRTALAERFRRILGCAPMSYLTELRLRSAMNLLRDGDLTIAEVAHQCGYGSDAAFSRAFKRQVGQSPSAVRGRACEQANLSRDLHARTQSV